MFLDEAVVEFLRPRRFGAVSFHTEKYVPRGGPNGADGGRGGDIILIADRGRRTLYDFKLLDHFEAQDGGHGVGNKRGSNGKYVEIKVPIGTVVTDFYNGEPIVDMSSNGMRYVLCKGGKGGFGNQHYVSSIRQAPNFAEKGEPGEKLKVKLELKLLADVGLIGLPNAGKSTLIARITSARPKIADYPFTTIVPNLGVVRFRDTSFVVADMPGLIQGASEGIGLGHQFLKHVERTRVLVHVVDCFPIDESDPMQNFHLIENELKLYSEEIWIRPRIIALNKIDILPQGQFGVLRERFEALEIPLYPISAVTGQGIEPLLNEIGDTLDQATEQSELPLVIPTLRAKDDLSFDVVPVENGFEVTGRRVERMVSMTDLENSDGVRYLHRRLNRIGVIERLREMGVQEGDNVYIGDSVFAFTDES